VPLQQLHYDAFFKETVHESAHETFRVRNVKIHYFLEDDSISVTEHYVPNAGLPQGTLLRRHRIPIQSEGRFYTASDLLVGTVRGGVFHLSIDDLTFSWV
jgi:hypothetical protein